MRLPLVLGLLAIATAIPAWVPFGSGARQQDATLPTLGDAEIHPSAIAGVAVFSRDEKTGAVKPFAVKRQGDQWVMPAYYNYPADANTRVSKIAAKLLGVKTSRLVGADPASHADLGVLDPTDDKSTAKEGFGKLVELEDRGGKKVLSLIIGKRSQTGEGMTYVRFKGQNEVYTAKVDEYEVSTKFTDYVETDPFKLKRDDITKVAVVDYTVDFDKQLVAPRATTRFDKAASGDWSTAAVPEGKRVAKAKVDSLLSELTYLRLAGVRPFHPAWLMGRGIFALDPQSVTGMNDVLVVDFGRSKAAIFGTEGRLDVTMKDGLRYSFLFGKPALSDEEDTDEQSTAKKKDEAKKDGEAPAQNRYLAVFVQYDAEADEEAKAAKPEEKKDEAKKDEKKKPTGKERAAKAQQRFQQFFYVISDASFKNLRPALDTLFEDKPKEPMAGSTGKTVKQWLEENGKKPGITTTASGLQWEEMTKAADGARKPGPTDTVQVRYKGTLIDGTVFDETKGDATSEFALNGVVKAWTEGLQLMGEGAKYRLFVPPELGYGEKGSGDKIGPNAILVFEVELVKIVTPAK